MISRREFCKSLLAANLVPAIPPEWAKIFCGMDFGKDSSKSVWLRGGYHSFWFNESVSIPWELFHKQLVGCFHIPKVDLQLGCSSPKVLHIKAKDIAPRFRKEQKLDEYKWLWFEEASEFNNWNWKGKKDA